MKYLVIAISNVNFTHCSFVNNPQNSTLLQFTVPWEIEQNKTFRVQKQIDIQSKKCQEKYDLKSQVSFCKTKIHVLASSHLVQEQKASCHPVESFKKKIHFNLRFPSFCAMCILHQKRLQLTTLLQTAYRQPASMEQSNGCMGVMDG